MPVVLVRAGEYSTALIGDELLGSREVVVKSVGPQLATIDGIAGAVDINPHRQGYFMPGTGHRIFGPDDLVVEVATVGGFVPVEVTATRMPDLVVLGDGTTSVWTAPAPERKSRLAACLAALEAEVQSLRDEVARLRAWAETQ